MRYSPLFIFGWLGLLLILSCQKKDQPLFRLVSPSESGITFRNDITESQEYNILNFTYLYNGGGVSVGDFNNDGLPDLFFSGNMVANHLYLNQGDLEFKEITTEAGVAVPDQWIYGSSPVDINGDGWLDLYLCASMAGEASARKNLLFINQGLNEAGIPTFENQAAAYGIDDTGHSSQATFLDYDGDNDLDLFILSNSKVEGIPSIYRAKVDDGSSDNTDKLYRNNGDGTFTNVSREAGILKEGFGLGVAVMDVNQDGYSDIYVGNDYLTNDLFYVNEGGQQFSDQIDEMIHHQSRFSMGNDASDINNDGHLDIITLDMLPESNLRKKTVISGNGYIVYINDNRFGYTHQYVRNMLQLNQGNQTFSEIGQLAGVHQTEWSWSPLFADVNNDGHRDLLVTNGFPKDITDNDFINFRKQAGAFVSIEQLLAEVPSVKIPNYVFQNQGNLTFTDVSAEWGFTQPSFSNGAAFADLDLDGDLDYVVNNIDDPAFLYENTTNSRPGAAHYLRVDLQGPAANPSGLGAKLTLTLPNGSLQYHEQNIYRGYVSTVEDVVHFGLGADTVVHSLRVVWPDGKEQLLENLAADQVIDLAYSDATAGKQAPQPALSSLTKEISHDLKLDYVHQEADYIDYNIQRNIPHKFSQSGPSLSVGDVNGDGREDLFTGGSTDHHGIFWLQHADGTFHSKALDTEAEKIEEDLGSLLFDADQDGDLDLYVVSGSFEAPEGSEAMQDRLYLNDGRGNFQLRKEALPELTASGSCVRAADWDADGDLDLFVGGRVVVGSYPLSPRSYLLQNDGQGNFSEVSGSVAPELGQIGMVTDAIWSDFNQDGQMDLIMVGEFMPIQFFANQAGKLVPHASGLESYRGWWNSIVAADIDADGDMDYVAGNFGQNNFYCASPDQPLRVTASDFDKNGAMDVVMSCYLKAEDGSMKPFPIHSWAELNAQSPMFRKRFDKYSEFGQTTIDSLFSKEELADALILEATHLSTSYLENLGNGSFAMHALPLEAQFAPTKGIQVLDLNEDGHLDIALVGNDFGNEVNAGQQDAAVGLVLLGDGAGNFAPLSPLESGFVVREDAKALTRLTAADGTPLLLASQNRGALRVFETTTTHSTVFEPEPMDASAILTYQDGSIRRVEFAYGGGFLSQASRSLLIAPTVAKLEVIDYAGQSREVSFTPDS